MPPALALKQETRRYAVKVETRKFGSIEVDEDKVINIPTGLPGFPGKDKFVLLEKEEARPFCWLQCVDDPEIALIVINPMLFKPDYNVDLSNAYKALSWEDNGNNIAMFVVVNIWGEPRRVTANLIGPIVINTAMNEAAQIVLHDTPYSVEHQVM